jgi:hypothetical protein
MAAWKEIKDKKLKDQLEHYMIGEIQGKLTNVHSEKITGNAYTARAIIEAAGKWAGVI